MAKNELLPFADGEDANVLPTNQWEALTDILENGFQSGIARSEQVNRVLAQGAVASYVLGQLIVDQLSKDATLDKDTLYQNLVSALQENAKDVCLPLSGGTVTGQLAVVGYLLAKSGYILKGDTDGALYVMSGSGWANAGGYLTLAPRDDANGANFQLTATDGTNTSQLKGTPNGSLIWAGKEVERVNSIGTNYVRHEVSGLQICWGRTNNPAESRNSSVTLPVAFKDTSYVPLAVIDSETGRFMATTTPTNTASFVVGSARYDDDHSGGRSVYWFCIGKWK